MTSILQNRAFVRYQLLRFCSVMGYQMVMVAVGWQVYEISNNAYDLGLVGLSMFLPFLILSLFSGDVADRYHRVLLLRITQFSYVGIAFAFWAMTRMGVTNLAAIYATIAWMGVTRAFSGPAASSLLPAIVPKEQFSTAIAWSSIVWEAATISGPPIGGLIYAWSGNAAGVYGTAIFFELMALVMILTMRVTLPKHEHKGQSTIQRIRDGFLYVWSNKVLLGAVSLDLFAVLFGGAVALLPIYAKDILHVGPAGLGILRGAPAAGAGLMAMFIAYFPLRSGAGKKMLIATAVFGAATCVFGWSTNFMVSFAALFVTGAADMISVIVRQTLVQIRTPDAMRGRVSAVNQVFIGASNELGEFESGITAGWFGTVPAVIFGGLATIGVTMLWAKIFPGLRKVQGLD